MNESIEKRLLSNDMSRKAKYYFLYFINYGTDEEINKILDIYEQKALEQFADMLDKEKEPPIIGSVVSEMTLKELLDRQIYTDSYLIYWLRINKPKGYENCIRQLYRRKEEVQLYKKTYGV